VSTYQWLLMFHVLAAFAFLSGAIVAGVLHALATRRDRPSEVALLLGLTRPAVAVLGIGSLAALGLGIWLVDKAGYDYGDGWIIAAFILWAASGALSGPAGKSLRHARELAERLAADGDEPSEALHRAVTNPRILVLNYLSFAALVVILVLMVFKPGAG
jgi:uncharacterized membrane protein